MKEAPIIMSGEHPRLVMDGRKTQTRRTKGLDKYNEQPEKWKIAIVQAGQHKWWSASCDWSMAYRIDCPYGQVGDRLWVRETLEKRNDGCAIYAADKEQVLIGGRGINEGVSWEWAKTKRPSRFMPRWASRITLEITEVRVERVQEITPLDAVYEGCPKYHEYDNGECVKTISPVDRFRNLWDSLNAKRGFSWESNPWVWVLTFKRIITG